jgi:hypothetical protein
MEKWGAAVIPRLTWKRVGLSDIALSKLELCPAAGLETVPEVKDESGTEIASGWAVSPALAS